MQRDVRREAIDARIGLAAAPHPAFGHLLPIEVDQEKGNLTPAG
jgi:hypothetical protein